LPFGKPRIQTWGRKRDYGKSGKESKASSRKNELDSEKEGGLSF